ncbi:hypothetical protein EDEG_00426 [Edhazardia aedis USNM 41457]|uniref:Uncharacterized protein n=1 Tax=Edhazardia aedis (strain USNM 41457) TaxID=1003232 RepID=J9DG02_EDHAE|nr:hypothetical protein EDEG_00426 [Edhazardia aedis USNM 41457]|eukprot:EJW01535.1 hypothetical protein EDEG_00426 [Edhazardia aedis USNM 41457]
MWDKKQILNILNAHNILKNHHITNKTSSQIIMSTFAKTLNSEKNMAEETVLINKPYFCGMMMLSSLLFIIPLSILYLCNKYNLDKIYGPVAATSSVVFLLVLICIYVVYFENQEKQVKKVVKKLA